MNQTTSSNKSDGMESVRCDICGGNDLRLVCEVVDKYGVGSQPFRLVRCAGCGLVFVYPRPTEDGIGDYYPNEYYDAEVFHQENDRSVMEGGEARRLSDIGRFAKTGTVLDIGCGNGRFLYVAQKQGWRTIGLEMDESAVRFAHEHYDLELMQGTLQNATFESESVDVITMWGVIEHLHHPKQAMAEVSRILKPGGLFVALVPNIGSGQFKVFGPDWYLLDIPRHLYHFSDATLGRLAGEAGLKHAWTRHYAVEHDVPNLVTSLETVLYRGGKPSGLHWRRVSMGLLRRAAPAVARGLAGCCGSAALEAYFIKR